MHEAFARRRRSARLEQLNDESPNGGREMVPATSLDPEQSISKGELADLLESAIRAAGTVPYRYHAARPRGIEHGRNRRSAQYF